MFEAKIVSGCWGEGTLELSGMPKDFILSARPLMVLEMDELNVNEELLEACKGLFSVLTKPNDTFHCPDEKRCEKDSCRDCPIIQPYHKAEKVLAKATQ